MSVQVRRHVRVKRLTCGHEQVVESPIPKPGDWVWCRTCNNSSRVPYSRPTRVADGRPRRLSPAPRGNNQWTRGRPLHEAAS